MQLSYHFLGKAKETEAKAPRTIEPKKRPKNAEDTIGDF
jgi:hypothetical protein